MTEAALTADHHGLDKKMVTFFGVLAAIFLSALDQTIVGTALPRIVSELRGFDRYTWVTTAYLLTATSVVPIVGKLSEQLGRKRVFLTGIVMFLAGSALCGAAQDMTQLILFRGLQGIGGGVLTGTAFAVIADLFAPAERAKYTGLVAGMFGIASIIGPLVGGYLTDNISWRWIFYVNLPIGAAVLVVLWYTFPSLHRIGDHKPQIDYLGALGIGSAAILLVLGASLAGTNDWSYPPVAICLIAGVLVLAASIWHENRAPEAIFPPALFKNSIFSLSMIITFLQGIAMFGTIVYVPLFLQAVVGVKATYSGLLLLPLMVGMVGGSIGGGLLLTRTGRYKIQSLVSFGLMIFGTYLLTRLTVNSTQGEVSIYVFAFGIGLGLSFAVFNVIAQNAVRAEFMSSATSAIQFVRQIGASLGLAVIGAIFNQQLRDNAVKDIPASALAQVPAAFRGQITNPQALFNGDTVKQMVAAIPAPERLNFVHNVLPQIFYGIKVALTGAIHVGFEISLGVAIVAALCVFFLKEVPLRKTSGLQDRAAVAAARAEAAI